MSNVYYIKEGILSIEEMHKETNPLKLIKWHCRYNCCAGDEKEWKECNNQSCPLWIMRMGKNPNRKKVEMTEERKEKLSQAREKYRQSKSQD